jgi:hypothetical protein
MKRNLRASLTQFDFALAIAGVGRFSFPTSMASNPPPDAKGNRARGWILAVLGPVLSIAMVATASYLWRITRPGTTSYHGSPEMTFNAFALFGTIFAFGLVCTIAGIFQIRTGRKNLAALVLILALFAVMIYFGYDVVQAGH